MARLSGPSHAASKTGGRFFVCDPMCVLPFGHNAPALTYFRDFASEGYDDVIAMCCNSLPNNIVLGRDFVPFFDFYYQDYFNNIQRIPTGRTPLPGWFLDEAERLATTDALAMLRDYDIGADDTVFHPHLDFYGAIGLLNALKEWPRDKHPQLLLRFIGVMENSSHSYRDPLAELLGRLKAAQSAGVRMEFSAETPRYADMLALELDALVTVTAYPEMSQPIPMRENGPFVFYCAGSARHDKGFMLLPEIFREVRRRDPELQIQFITQLLPDRDLHQHFDAARALYAIPGVELQESAISSEEMIATYRRSHAVLLPYDVATYRHRGSAVLMEAAFHGRPAITFSGSAFADIARHYNLGLVVEDQEAMVEAIIEMAQTPRKTLVSRAAQARHRFHLDNSAAFKTWLGL